MDTNVLVHAANTRAPEHEACRELLEGWRQQSEPWHVTWNILYEFLSVTTHPSTFQLPWAGWEALEFIDWLREAPALTVLDHTTAHLEVLRVLEHEVMLLRGRFFHDAHTVAIMREHGVRTIYTRDRAFIRFPSVEVIDPLTA